MRGVAPEEENKVGEKLVGREHQILTAEVEFGCETKMAIRVLYLFVCFSSKSNSSSFLL